MVNSNRPAVPGPAEQAEQGTIPVGFGLYEMYVPGSRPHYDDRTLEVFRAEPCALREHSEHLHAWALARLGADRARDGVYEAQFRLLHPHAGEHDEEEHEDEDYTVLRSEYLCWDGVGEHTLTPWLAPELTR